MLYDPGASSSPRHRNQTLKPSARRLTDITPRTGPRIHTDDDPSLKPKSQGGGPVGELDLGLAVG